MNARWVRSRFIVASWQNVAGLSRDLPIVRKKRDSSCVERSRDWLAPPSFLHPSQRTWNTSFRMVSTRFSSCVSCASVSSSSTFAVPEVEALGVEGDLMSFRRFTARSEDVSNERSKAVCEDGRADLRP